MSAATRIAHTLTNDLLLKCSMLFALASVGAHALPAQNLPDAPSAVLMLAASADVDVEQQQPQTEHTNTLPSTLAAPTPAAKGPVAPPPCTQADRDEPTAIPWSLRSPHDRDAARCHSENPLQEIISSKDSPPLTPKLKAYLAIRNVIDPFNLITIAGYSGIQIAVNSHTAYGPGYKGWGRLAGYSMLEDMQSEFFGTFAIPSLVHEDPRYHRMTGASIKRRLGHALIHTVWTQHDDGTPMINYATLLTYPVSAELSNLYVPGISTNGTSTAKRILAGYATDPIGPLIAEFLPDVAKHIHIRVVFVQQILQKIAVNQPNTM